MRALPSPFGFKKIKCFLFYILCFSIISACGGSGKGSADEDRASPPETMPNNTAPTITLLGENEVLIIEGNQYTDAGAEASDSEDGNLTANIVVEGEVNTDVPGEYTLTYSVSDSQGLSAVELTRTIRVRNSITFAVDNRIEQVFSELEGEEGEMSRPVGAIESVDGKAHLVLDVLMIKTDDASEVDAFIGRHGGNIIEVIEFEDIPDIYVVGLDPNAANTDALVTHVSTLLSDDIAANDESNNTSNMSLETFETELKFSSESAMKLFAIMADEMVNHDLEISLNWLMLDESVRSGSTEEELESFNTMYTPNAFNWPYMSNGSTQDTGVTSAWRLLDLLNIDGSQEILVFDSGFVDIGDYPSTRVPAGSGWGQRSGAGCSSSGCYWHGTEVAHVAMGEPDNGIGVAGAAGIHARLNPVQFTGVSVRGTFRLIGRFLEILVENDLQIINVSGSVGIPVPANIGLNAFLDPVFRHAYNRDVLIVAAAGNDGNNVDNTRRFLGIRYEVSTVVPCENSRVICVGGLEWDGNQLAEGSNFGSQAEADSVDIYAPYEYWVPEIDEDGVNTGRVKLTRGTSFSAPFVSGTVALMAAADPNISAERAHRCLFQASDRGDRVRIHEDGGNQLRLDAYESVLCAMPLEPEFPLLVLDSPAPFSSYMGRELVEFSASSLGRDGDPLPIVWRSGLDGEVASSGSAPFSLRTLSVGTHVLTATTTDTDGTTRSEQVIVTITNNLPSVEILSPVTDDRFAVSQSIQLTASAEDEDALSLPGGIVPDSQITWSIDGTTFSGSGRNVTVPAGFLTEGIYTARVVVDDGTDSAEDSVQFEVSACVGECPVASILQPGDIVVKTSGFDDFGYFAELDFEGLVTDAEDGEFGGSVNNGRMSWTRTSDSGGNRTSLCEPLELSPPDDPFGPQLPDISIECKNFSRKLYLDESSAATTYLIILEATDSDGNRTTDSVTVRVEFNLI